MQTEQIEEQLRFHTFITKYSTIIFNNYTKTIVECRRKQLENQLYEQLKVSHFLKIYTVVKYNPD